MVLGWLVVKFWCLLGGGLVVTKGDKELPERVEGVVRGKWSGTR